MHVHQTPHVEALRIWPDWGLNPGFLNIPGALPTELPSPGSSMGWPLFCHFEFMNRLHIQHVGGLRTGVPQMTHHRRPKNLSRWSIPVLNAVVAVKCGIARSSQPYPAGGPPVERGVGIRGRDGMLALSVRRVYKREKCWGRKARIALFL